MKPDIAGLMKLGRFLRTLPKKNFRQNTWFEEKKAEAKEDCGTAGCVAGWAATIFPHRFQKIGVDEHIEYDGSQIVLYDVVHRRSRTEGAEAFATGFRIPYHEAERITEGGAHRNSAKVAANNIFALVKRLKKAAKR